MSRIQLAVEMRNIYSYEAPSYGYGYETRYIYTMVGEDGKTYVWKTTSFMTIEVPYTGVPGHHCFEDRKGNPIDHEAVNKGDRLIIKATVKGESEYKGQPQTELTRVNVIERTFRGETPEEIKARLEAEKAAKKQEQLDSIREGDFVWRMPYKQYKEHYSDCETVIDSYVKRAYARATIEVIIREGRLVASGVRGQHFSGYEMRNAKGEFIVYRAVSEENAMRRVNKEYPNEGWECVKIYR